MKNSDEFELVQIVLNVLLRLLGFEIQDNGANAILEALTDNQLVRIR